MQNTGYRLTKIGAHLIDCQQTLLHVGTQQYSQHTVATQPNLIDYQLGSLETEQDGVQAKNVAIDLLTLQGTHHQLAHAFLVTLVQRGCYLFANVLVECQCLFLLLSRKFQSFCHDLN